MILGRRVKSDVLGLFLMGLFFGNIGLFCGDIGLFCGNIGLLCGCTSDTGKQSQIGCIWSLSHGGPEPVEEEINIYKILSSKRDDRLSGPFFGSGTNNQFGSFFVPASPQRFL